MRKIPSAQAWQLSRACVRRARRRVKQGWDPACGHVLGHGSEPILCGAVATHVDINMNPLCELHAVKYSEKFR